MPAGTLGPTTDRECNSQGPSTTAFVFRRCCHPFLSPPVRQRTQRPGAGSDRAAGRSMAADTVPAATPPRGLLGGHNLAHV
jgi:hypothetical protein